MNKEYKLLKKYPSLAKDWEIGMKVGLGDRNYGYSPCAGNYSDCRKLDNNEVENNSEYWELVVEDVVTKDYKILSLIFNRDNDIIRKGTILIRGNDTENLVYNDYWGIHSIKRLSDNEVFTLKDKTKEGVILEFDTPGTNKAECRYRVDDSGKGWRMIRDAIKVKEPLFKTFDGVEIFENQPYWGVYTTTFKLEENLVGCKIWDIPDYFEDKEGDEFLSFSTLFAAKKFIKENQKRYSLNDIKETVNKLGCFSPIPRLIEYLENEI